MQRRSIILGAAGLAVAGAAPWVRAQGLAKFKFNLGWRVEASGAGYLLALQRGYYRDAGLDVIIDTGNGSAGAISLVAGGAYEAASADLSTMIEFNTANPDKKLAAVAVQYDLNPNSIIVRRDSGIVKPADLAGKTILGQPFNASRKLFPAFAKANGFDGSTVKWENVEPGIGDTRFARGDFDGAAYFYFTGLLNLKARGVMPEQLRVFRYSDHGLAAYGNGIVTNAKTMAEMPQALGAFVRASTRGWLDCIADPKAGAAAVKAREPLANEELELERLQLITSGSMVTAGTRSHGWGAATSQRMQATIDETVAAFGLKPGVTVADIWTDRFLPAAADRTVRAAA
jgi:NitT/TauT family transport system substrate-binding protein